MYNKVIHLIHFANQGNKSMLIDMKIEKKSSLRSQIGNKIRDAIMRGKIPAGSKLPTTQELAQHWDTPAANVHAALSPLVKEGLLLRKPGIGTVVNEIERKLTTIAIYAPKTLRHPSSVYEHLLVENIEKILVEKNIECRLIFENRENNGFAHIVDLADSREIQGLIVPSTNRYRLAEIQKLPIPIACLTSARIKNRVVQNSTNMIDQIIKAVELQEGTKLGIISANSDCKDPMESGEIERHNFYLKLFDSLQSAGIENRPEWNCIPGDEGFDADNHDYFSYNGFNQIWQSSDKPDSLLIYPDILVMGALLAINSHNIKIPQQLRLITHRNSGNNLLCPVPCYFIENSVEKTAQGLVDLIMDQFNGKEIKQLELDFKLIKHQP